MVEFSRLLTMADWLRQGELSNIIGVFWPIAPWRRSSLSYLRQSLQLFSGVCKAQEPMRVETLGSEATVEGFDERVIGRISRP
jgi:hypothetical protein